jgi:quercetin 2,3-dioxygenase
VSTFEAGPPTALDCPDRPEDNVRHELVDGREVVLGGPRGMAVTRTLPSRERPLVGPWCFLDHFGPARHAMRVPPHPHTGLQTVTWLLEGEVLHRDSLGTAQLIRPGQLNLMTAGHGIAHSEESTRPGPLHGVQLWVALPPEHRERPAAFEHHSALPTVTGPGVRVTVMMGRLAGVTSAAEVFGPVVGAEITMTAGATMTLPLEHGFEYGVLALTGAAEAAGVALRPGPLLYLGRGRRDLRLAASEAARLMLIGGEPYPGQIVMWWNFVGTDHAAVAAARADWAAGRRFGPVRGFDGDPIPAPDLPTTVLKPRGHRPDPDGSGQSPIRPE